MNISTSTAAESLAANISPIDNKRAQLQVSLLKKALDSQEQQAAELLKIMEGKGQVVDLRV